MILWCYFNVIPVCVLKFVRVEKCAVQCVGLSVRVNLEIPDVVEGYLDCSL